MRTNNYSKLCLVLVFCITGYNLFALFSGGTGTEHDPWQIANSNDLDYIRNYLGAEHADKHYIQTSNIDIGMQPWNVGEGWIPIGMFGTAFCGKYNGDYHVISGMYINRPNAIREQGLFGYADYATIKNLGVTNVNIHGWYRTGALCGYSKLSEIYNCYSTGSVVGVRYVGGLIGYLQQGWTAGSLKQCFSTCRVSGHQDVGGLCGVCGGRFLHNSYSTGIVDVYNKIGGGFVGRTFSINLASCYTTAFVSGGIFTGGLIGYNSDNDIVEECYWNTDTAVSTIGEDGEKRLTSDMTFPYSVNTYQNWDFENIWVSNPGYPYHQYFEEGIVTFPDPAILPYPANSSVSVLPITTLNWQPSITSSGSQPLGFKLWLGTDNPPTNMENGIDLGWQLNYAPPQGMEPNQTYYWKVVPYNNIDNAVNCQIWSFDTGPFFSTGAGTEDDPWQVNTAEELSLLRDFLGFPHADKFFVQTDDLDLGVAPWNQGEGWNPIGGKSGVSYDFCDSFCGSYDGNGFFIDDMHIHRSDKDHQGLFGYLHQASISNLGVRDVAIDGRDYVGALSGLCENKTSINQCFATGNITGRETLGGLVGLNTILVGSTEFVPVTYPAMISNSYSHCNMGVTGNGNKIGGLAGSNIRSQIVHSYSTGLVPSVYNRGGLVGSVDMGGSYLDDGNYWDTERSQCSSSPMGYSRTTSDMTYPYAADTFVEWDFENIWVEDRLSNVNSGYPYHRWQLGTICQRPDPATNPYPGDNSTAIIPIAELSWDPLVDATGSNSPTGYLLWLGTNNPPADMMDGIDIGNQTSYTIPFNLEFNTTYYWMVCPYNNLGYADNCPVWSFHTHPFSGGSGTAADPWRIASPDNLNYIRNYLGTSHQNKYFIQIADICLDTAPWNQNEGWVPIGNAGRLSKSNPFCGRYNGNGYHISGLTINRPNAEQQALFGYTQNATLTNIKSYNTSISGGSYSGGIIGYGAQTTISFCRSQGMISGTDYTAGIIGMATYCQISNCSWSGTVSGADSAGGISGYLDHSPLTGSFSLGTVSGGNYVGGISGEAAQTSIVSDCYSLCNVNCNTNAGGLAGRLSSSSLVNNYSSGCVSGNSQLGGLLGSISSGIVNNCFWDTESSGMNTSAAGEGKTSMELKRIETYTEWDFDSVWNILSGFYVSYPFLRSNLQDPAPGIIRHFEGGDGTEADPWQISNGMQLNLLRHYLGPQYQNKYYVLTNDINLGIAPWNLGEGWNPIGTDGSSFQGNINGADHEIKNLYINRPSAPYQGLFGVIENATIKNLGSINSYVIGFYYSGGLAGFCSDSQIIHCYHRGMLVSANPYGNTTGGGLLGVVINSTITWCYSNGYVNSTGDGVGGLVGQLIGSSVDHSFSSGTVVGRDKCGGLIGICGSVSFSPTPDQLANQIDCCFSSCFVQATFAQSSDHIQAEVSNGAFVGNIATTDVFSNCYTNGKVDGLFQGKFYGQAFLMPGYPCSFVNCYSSSTQAKGCFWGGWVDPSWLNNVYWITYDGGYYSVGGRSISDMTYPYGANTYVGYDFENIWAHDTIHDVNNGFPYLYEVLPVVVEIPANEATIIDIVTISSTSTLYRDPSINFNSPVLQTLPNLDNIVIKSVIGLTGSGYNNIICTIGTGKWYSYIYMNNQWLTASPDYLVGPGDFIFSNVNFDAKGTVIIVFAAEYDPNVFLPVTLSGFTASPTATNSVVLRWVTESENELLGFRILRNDSDDLSDALLISGLIPASNTSTQHIYDHEDCEVYPGITYYYWLEVVEYSVSDIHGPVAITLPDVNAPELPEVSVLFNAYPNPCRMGATATINANVKEGETGSLTIYNVKGQLIITYPLHEGYHSIHWKGTDKNGAICGSGIYFYSLSTETCNKRKKFLLLK